MTIEELQRYARHLSNYGWCRWWAHFNWPQNPAKMAIQVLDYKEKGFEPVRVLDLERLGFHELDDNKDGAKWLYVIDRTNEDGTPFVSKL